MVKKTLESYSWAEIATISETGEAVNYFNVGDEKKITIGSETYHAQIIGFNHDDKSDGSGKAGITLQFKELMTTTHNINDTDTKLGGWKDSKMRTYLNETVHNALPSDLQAVIKTVDKVSDNGNMYATTLNTTHDKLFLLSLEKVGFTSSDVYGYYVDGQGTKYEYFTDNNSRAKKYLGGSVGIGNWWLRSANTNNTGIFFYVFAEESWNYGGWNYGYVYYDRGVAPAFCI